MITRTYRPQRHCSLRVFSWVIAAALVFSLVAVPASADPDTFSAELVLSSEEMDISGKIVLDTANVLLGVIASMGSGGVTMMDAAAYLSPQAIAAQSVLIGGAYGFDLSSIQENLPKSIFAPDSGSAYALDQESYDQVMAILEQKFPQVAPAQETPEADTSALEQAAAVLAEALAEPASQIAAMLVMETANVTETINGAEIDATRMRITAGEEALIASAEAFATTIQGSPEAQSALAVILDAISTAGMDMGASGTEIVQMIVQQGDQLLEEVRTSIQESQFSFSILASLSNTTQAPVKLALELQAEGSVLTFNVLIGEALDFFRLELLENGQPGPAIQFEMSREEQTRLFAFSLWNGDVTEASVALALDMGNQTFQLSAAGGETANTVSGYFTTSENLFSLVVDKVDGQAFGATLALNLRSDDTLTLPAFTEITAMTEEEFTMLVEQISQTIEGLSQMYA